MGCTSVTNSSVKNPQIAGFFAQCEFNGFTEARVVKVTKCSYQYIRGIKEWNLQIEKNIFHHQYPVLLSPCEPENFDRLVQSVSTFKSQYEDQFRHFPQNLGMLLCVGDKFPKFRTEILGSEQVVTYEVQNQMPTLLVHWRLEELKTIQKMNHTQRSVLNRFAEDKAQKYLETSFERAKAKIRTGFQIVGVCQDEPSRKKEYEEYIKEGETHIWVQDQGCQVFRFAEDEYNQIRGLNQSIYVIVNGIFMGCLRENFGDPQYVDTLFDRQQSNLNTQSLRQQRFSEQIKMGTRRDDYHRVKSIIKDKLNDYDKQPIGDTFKLSVEKYTYFYNYQKIGATYCQPQLHCAGSEKYKQNSENLLKWLRNLTPIAHMDCDFKNRESLNKTQFFKRFCTKLKTDTGYEDMRFILEKSMVLKYEDDQFKFIKSIDGIHNAPLPVGAVFSRKEHFNQLCKEITAVADTYSHCEFRLLKEYLNNPYGVNTQFNIGQLYSPIPNVYSVTHTDQSGQIAQSTIRNYPKGIFDSKLVQSMNNSQDQLQFPIIEQIPSNVSRIELSDAWDGLNQQDLNYDQVDVIQQLNKEVLVIYLLEYNDSQVELLSQLLNFVKQQNWTNDLIRVIGLSTKVNDELFEKTLHKFQLDRHMSLGVFESWFPIESTFLNVNFYKMLSDLYGLQQSSPVLVIDQLGRLLFRGQPDKNFVQILRKIVHNQDIRQTIYAPDRQLKHRIDLAQFEKEWVALKSFKLDKSAKEQLIKFTQLFPIQKHEQWQLKIQQFQLWDQNGVLLKKFYEKPQILYKFDRPELSVKFYDITQQIIRRIGEKKIDIIDLNKSKGINKGHQLLGEALVQS